MPTTRLDISYLGSGFSGWGRQPGLRTVQGELENGLSTVLGEPVELTVAGRTDAGVHAWGQVASFQTAADPPPNLARRLNGIGPPDITVRSATQAPNGFDARRSARSRTYCYRVLSSSLSSPFEEGRAWWWPYRVDLKGLEDCAGAIRGVHDFTAFTPTETEHVRFERRVMRAEWRIEHWPGHNDGDVFTFEIEADSFMRNMVRVLVGTMLEVASGSRAPDCFDSLLRGAPRSEAGQTAPAHGLYLAAVSY